MVVFHDDEYCLRPEVLQSICEDATNSNSSLYAGHNLWKTAAYKQQNGSDGTFAPYFSGWLYALSSDLVRAIASDPRTLFTSMNLGYAEDLQVGKWVQNQSNKKDRSRKIKYVQERTLLWRVSAPSTSIHRKDEVSAAPKEEDHTALNTALTVPPRFMKVCENNGCCHAQNVFLLSNLQTNSIV